MAGELDRIGGRRGSIRIFETLIRIVLKRNIPRAIVEKLLWDLLTDMLKEVVKGDKDKQERDYALILPPIPIAPNLNLVVPGNAQGVRILLQLDPSIYGRIPGRGVAPDVYALNAFSDSPCWFGFGSDLFNYGFRKVEFASQAILFSDLPTKPKRFYLYTREGITGSVNWLRYK